MIKVIFASTKDSDMFYAAKGEVSDAFFLIDTGEKKYIFLDNREYPLFVEHNKDPRVEVILVNPFIAQAQAMTEKTSLWNRVGYLLFEKYGLLDKEISVPNSFPLDMADYFRSKGLKLAPKSPFYPERLKKTKEEVDKIEDAIKRTQGAFQLVEKILAESKIEGDAILYQGQNLTSEKLKSEVERLLLGRGLLSSEGLIISCAQHAAIPHHRGAGLLRPHQTIIVDLFPKDRHNGYFADMTRTYVKGNPSEYVVKMYEAVQEAQEKAEAAIKDGMKVNDIHKICIDTFLSRGFHAGDKGFVHGTGHGLGLDIHESPFMRGGYTDILAEGNVVTVEPGLYYPEHGGIRIEDVVWVTKQGSKNLTNYPKNGWIIA